MTAHGMLPDGAEPFHAHSGVLVDDQGHPHDLSRVVEEVLIRVDCPVPDDVRRWLQRDFFPYHLKQYSKSRRKAPIYWPLSTTSGSYTVWVYYSRITEDTLYRAVTEHVEPNLRQVQEDRLKAEAEQSRAEGREAAKLSKQAAELAELERELEELRIDMLRVARLPYKPDLNDGVQITAAPLYKLFRHKPWQNVLEDTWRKLEKGEYDWAHLAYAIWPDRVREKCKSDKSLAIAHGLVELYESNAKPAPNRRRRASA